MKIRTTVRRGDVSNINSQKSKDNNQTRSLMPVAHIEKPKRPLTAYHCFFQLEREYILQNIESPEDGMHVEVDVRPVGREIDAEMPTRYKNIHLSPLWGIPQAEQKKRKHRKSHGKITFRELSSQVASRWATLEETDNETKMYCAKIAQRELHSYKEKVKVYKAKVADLKKQNFKTVANSNSPAVVSPKNTLIASIPSSSIVPSIKNQTGRSISNSKMKSSPTVIMDKNGPTNLKIAKAKSETKNEITSNGKKYSFIANIPSTSPVPSINNQTSGSISVGTPESSPVVMINKNGPTGREIARAKLKIKNENTSNEEDFSFIPLPPILQEREDLFLKYCQVKTSHPMLIPSSQYAALSTDALCNRHDDLNREEAKFNSAARYLNVQVACATESENEVQARLYKETKQISKHHEEQKSSRTAGGDISPLLYYGNSLEQMEYNFSTDDAKMLMNTLFP